MVQGKRGSGYNRSFDLCFMANPKRTQLIYLHIHNHFNRGSQLNINLQLSCRDITNLFLQHYNKAAIHCKNCEKLFLKLVQNFSLSWVAEEFSPT